MRTLIVVLTASLSFCGFLAQATAGANTMLLTIIGAVCACQVVFIVILLFQNKSLTDDAIRRAREAERDAEAKLIAKESELRSLREDSRGG